VLQGGGDEHGARPRGISAQREFQTFFRVTLPAINNGRIYGVVLCLAIAGRIAR